MADYSGALPQPTPESQPYWDGLKEHKLILPHCRDCGTPHFYPRPFCLDPDCFKWEIDWREVSGKGRVHTFVISHLPIPPMETAGPYVIAVVELAEGPRMMSNLIIDAPDQPTVAMPVEIVYDDVTDEVTLPKFRPV